MYVMWYWLLGFLWSPAESKLWFTRQKGNQLSKVINKVLELQKYIIGILPPFFVTCSLIMRIYYSFNIFTLSKMINKVPMFLFLHKYFLTHKSWFVKAFRVNKMQQQKKINPFIFYYFLNSKNYKIHRK